MRNVTYISTHSPRVGRTFEEAILNRKVDDFNSLAPCGANHETTIPYLRQRRFQLTRPVWGEPVTRKGTTCRRRHFNSLAPCGANPFSSAGMPTYLSISTHSPRVGRTHLPNSRRVRCDYFNSLAPCGANPFPSISTTDPSPFQLTRPVWGEPRQPEFSSLNCSISTHSPRVGRTRAAGLNPILAVDFNSLAPCGANPGKGIPPQAGTEFQLTRPVWGEPRDQTWGH